MKKIFLILLGLFLIIGLSYSQSIMVMSPHNGDSFLQSESMNIVWKSIGIKGNVKITLRKSDGSGGIVIVNSCSVNRSPYKYNLSGVDPGSYFIKIKQGKIFGKSTVFNVVNKRMIKVTSPKAINFSKSTPLVIEWDSAGIEGRVDISLRKADGSGGVKLGSYYDSLKQAIIGLEKFAIGKYFVKVKQGNVFGISEIFTITGKSASIDVLSPRNGVIIYKYDTFEIKWQFVGFKPVGDVAIYLYKNGRKVVLISSGYYGQTSQSLMFTKENPYNGQGFKFRIEAKDSNGKKIIGENKGTFSIRTKSNTNTIQSLNFSPHGFNNNNATIAQQYQIKTPTLKVDKPKITIKNIYPSNVKVESGKKLQMNILIENCSKAQIVELAVNRIYALNVMNGKFNNIFELSPKKTGTIRVEAYNAGGWQVKNFQCTVLEKGYYSYPDLTVKSIVASDSYGGKSLKRGKDFNLGVTILNKGADIPRGTLIRIVRDKVYAAHPTVKKDYIQEYFGGLKKGQTTFFNYILNYGRGTHTILIEVDPDGYVKDRDRSNNSKRVNINVN